MKAFNFIIYFIFLNLNGRSMAFIQDDNPIVKVYSTISNVTALFFINCLIYLNLNGQEMAFTGFNLFVYSHLSKNVTAIEKMLASTDRKLLYSENKLELMSVCVIIKKFFNG